MNLDEVLRETARRIHQNDHAGLLIHGPGVKLHATEDATDGFSGLRELVERHQRRIKGRIAFLHARIDALSTQPRAERRDNLRLGLQDEIEDLHYQLGALNQLLTHRLGEYARTDSPSRTWGDLESRTAELVHRWWQRMQGQA